MNSGGISKQTSALQGATSIKDPQRDDRIDSIEILRGLAALAVAWFHFTNSHESWARISGSQGHLGVDVFFVLSGFVIPLAIYRGYTAYSLSDFPGFLARRLVRLEPPYLASVVLALALWELSARAPGFAGEAPEWSLLQVLFHIAYAVPLTSFDWLQPVYWTLAYEFVFYVVAGLLHPFYANNRRQPWLICVGVVTMLCALNALPPRCLLFLIGIAAFRRLAFKDPLPLTIFVCAGCGAAMALLRLPLAGVVAIAVAIVLLASAKTSLRSGFWKPLLWLGTISYSIYLVHLPVGGRVVNLLGRVLPQGPVGELLASLAALLVSLLFATLFYRLVEKPAILPSRRIRTGRVKRAVAPTHD